MEYGRESEQRTANNNSSKLMISKNATVLKYFGSSLKITKNTCTILQVKITDTNNFLGLYLHVILLPGTLMDCMLLIALM